ncbi:MAG: hemolysin family protein [Endomicrobia bacterium]|nr:hemolysin family protein [Endomicrobiia bacterium]
MLVLVKIFLYATLVLMSAFFAGIETALLKYTANKVKIKDSLLSKIILWKKSPERILSTILIGTNLACIGIGVLSSSLNIWVGYSVLILLVFGEMLPKIFALSNPQKFINLGFNLLISFGNFISFFVKVLSDMSIYVSKILFGVENETPFITKQDLKKIINYEEGLDKEEKFLYNNIIELADKKIYEIMLPKEKIFAIDFNWTLDEIIDKLRNVKFSRVPVFKDNIDNIVGIIYTKDLILAMQNREILLLDDLIRKAYYVVQSTRVIDVLRKFKEGQYHMAIVVDEYGSTVGLVTIEDIIEEVVGEVYDEYDVEEKKIVFLDNNILIVNGSENLKTIITKLEISLSEVEGVVTIGGYVATKLGYIPQVGEKVVLDNIEIEILESTDKMIKKLKISKLN